MALPSAWAAEGGADLPSSIELMGARMQFPRNAEVYGEGEPADFLYKVVKGTVRTCKVLADGRRQIGGFHFAGDVFGLEWAEERAYSAEAVTDATVLVIRKSAVLALAKRDGDIARQLWDSTARELSLVQRRVLLLIKSAQERVAGFLLEMSERSPLGGAVELTMTRQDIADYLGLTIETVSRTLTSFQESAMIELSRSRHILLRDRAALRDIWAS
jgi:CRP-like cAMP-binding protein